MVVTLKLPAMGAGLLPDKEEPFFFSLVHEYRSLLKIESIGQ
jgi:hypothetical protein